MLANIEYGDVPSPYYHFAYDSAGRPASVGFSGGSTTFDFSYSDGKLATIYTSRTARLDSLHYVYDGARVALVKYVDSTGVYALVFLTYDGARLTALERDRRVAGGYAVEKTMSFAYNSAGNLTRLVTHYTGLDETQPEATTTDTFANYDTSANVEDFSLVHGEPNDRLIYLPGVRLQLNNPATETRTSDGDNYTIAWTYTYDSRHRPTSKTGDLTFTNGARAGTHLTLTGAFSYY